MRLSSLCLFLLCALGSLPARAEDSKPDPIRQPWVMHHVSDDYLIANSLGEGDVNKDGYPDYAVIDERAGAQTILLHPGKDGDVRKPWPRLVLGVTGNPEYSCLGDVDGDSNLDVVVVEGDDLEKGLTTGVRIIFGPNPAKVMDPNAWINAGHVPGTEGEQYEYCLYKDINGDGATDIVFGGRRNSMTNKYCGLRWLEAPVDPAKRRDLSAWRQHFIDPDALSAHAFVLTDIDQDGDEDIVDANADWDTSLFSQELYWYENPGPGKPEQVQPWKRHSIWKSTEFYAKPQVGIGDVNGDGLLDLVTQTQNFVHVFIKQSTHPVKWDRIAIQKPDLIQWLGRPIKFADINGDGRLDIVGMLIHNDGNLPAAKASVFWMEYKGGKPGKEWNTYPIKMADGYNSYDQWRGEKWDHCLLRDLDGDGDLDIIGNVEEHYHWVDGKPQSFFSVVWFENPTK